MRVKIRELRLSYESAVKNNLKIFNFGELQFVTAYAKYLLQFLESKGLRDSDLIELEQEESELSKKLVK